MNRFMYFSLHQFMTNRLKSIGTIFDARNDISRLDAIALELDKYGLQLIPIEDAQYGSFLINVQGRVAKSPPVIVVYPRWKSVGRVAAQFYSECTLHTPWCVADMCREGVVDVEKYRREFGVWTTKEN